MRLYPAIDILDGQCVRLYQGNYSKATVYGKDPVAVAQSLVRRGARRLHLVDLNGAKDGHPVNLPIIQAIREAVEVPLQVGGGLRTLEDIGNLLAVGVERVVVGTRAAQEASFLRSVLEAHGERIVLGLDARDGNVAVDGWQRVLPRPAVDLAMEAKELGAKEAVFTDVAIDGTMAGPNLKALAEMGATGLKIIASGGISSLDDLDDVARVPGVVGAIVGKAIYAGGIKLEEAVKLEENSAG